MVTENRRQVSAPYSRHHAPGTSPLAKADDIADLAAKLEQLAKIVVGDDKGGPKAPTVGPSPAVADTTSLYLSRSLRRWRMIGGALVAVTVAAGTIAANLYAYIQGYADERAEEILKSRAEAERARELGEQVQKNTEMIGALQSRPQPDSRDLEEKVEKLRVLNALQWSYVTDVVEAIQARRRPPGKSQDLIEAEQDVLGEK
jgi:hypothetical protein